MNSVCITSGDTAEVVNVDTVNVTENVNIGDTAEAVNVDTVSFTENINIMKWSELLTQSMSQKM